MYFFFWQLSAKYRSKGEIGTVLVTVIIRKLGTCA